MARNGRGRAAAPAILSAPKRAATPAGGTELTGALLKADMASLTVTGEKDGKLRVRCSSWDEARIVQPGRQLVIRNVDGQAHVYDVAQ